VPAQRLFGRCGALGGLGGMRFYVSLVVAEGESRVLNQGQGSNIGREVTCKLLRL
jgi:hypothetical protein